MNQRLQSFIIVLAAMSASVAVANPLNANGQSGVARTTSTYALGKGSINTGVGFKADYAYHGIYLSEADGSTQKDNPTLLSEDVFFGYGVTNWFDASIDLPIYQDIWSDHSDHIAGLGDMTIGIKLQHPGLYQEAPFRMAYLLRTTFPTGTDNAGYYPRHVYHANSTSNSNGAYTIDGVALNPMMLWSLDLSKFPMRLPLALHTNFGGVVQVTTGENGSYRRQHSALLGNFAAEYQINNSFGVFMEISGEAKLYEFVNGYNFTTDLNNDVLRFALGSTYKHKSGFNTSLSFDLGLTQRNKRLSYTRENDDGVEETYTTSKTPRFGLNLSIGYARKGKDAGHVLGRFFAPEDTVTIMKIDTVVRYDTMQVLSHDTLKIVKNDTIKVQIRDTVVIVKNDTLKIVKTLDPVTIIQYGVLVFPSINFEMGSAQLTTSSYATLDDIAQSMKTFPEVKVEVRGYTDVTGSEERNQIVSQERAQSVVNYLVGKGVDKNRFVAKGLGASNPIASNTTTEGRVLNRRVEIKRIDIKK